MKYLLIGKPNVGKSSIYNLLTKSSNLTHRQKGTTKDWHTNNISDLPGVIIYDTPGVLIANNKINNLNFYNLFNEVDKFLYVIDYNAYLENEFESINNLRKFNKEIIIIANKDDNFQNKLNLDNFGFKYFYISCAHRLGFQDLYDYFIIQDTGNTYNTNEYFSFAIYGKPNAGKSTLVNSLMGYERVLTSADAGTTSDYVEDMYSFKNKNFKLIDTAGIFKKNKIDIESLNYYAIRKSLNIIYELDLNILLIDSIDGFDSQIKKILNILIDKSKSIIIIFNKIDLIKDKKNFIKETNLLVKKTFSKTKNISIIFLSAKNINSVSKLKNTIYIKSKIVDKKISTSKLTNFLKKITADKPHPLVSGKIVKFKYAVQISSHPLIIKIFTNFQKEIKKNYKTYIENNIIQKFNITDTKIKLLFVTSKNPFS